MTLCKNLTREQSNSLYLEVLQENNTDTLRRLCREDLFFLLTVACKRKDINRQWLYERCREVEIAPDGHIDLWAREHYKSTIITFGKSIQDILKDPNVTIGIFSHTRPIAKGFLDQIKREFEMNRFLIDLFPDILYNAPSKEATKWSIESGIIVKRDTNPKESTVEAWGLVDGQPTSKHFKLLVYDDVVTRESVTTPEQIKKVTDAWALSLNLGADGGVKRIIGTRYHGNDTYKTMQDRNSAKVREHAPTDRGKDDFLIEGTPVLLSRDDLIKKRSDMGPYIYACQMLQNPMADSAMGFKLDWVQHYDLLRNTEEWNHYLLCDPAGEKKRTNDYTVMLIIALAPDGNYYLVDGLRSRLNLTERTNSLMDFHRKYKPLAVGYEKYGKDSDIEHIEYVMERENYRFRITPLGGAMPKNDRIRRLVPIFEGGRFWLPHFLYFLDHERKKVDLVHTFLSEEYEPFPVCSHDDILDCASRIVEKELAAAFPEPQTIKVPSITMHRDEGKCETEYALFG